MWMEKRKSEIPNEVEFSYSHGLSRQSLVTIRIYIQFFWLKKVKEVMETSAAAQYCNIV